RAEDIRSTAASHKPRAPSLEERPDLPRIRKDRLRERTPQIRSASRSARAALRADVAFHHLYVPVTPFLHALIEIDESLAQLSVLRIVSIDVDQNSLHLGRRLHRRNRVALELGGRHAIALPRE